MRIRLGVNVDHVATVRQARGTTYPDPVEAARLAERAGAQQITVHLREDRRHIQDHDLVRLKKSCRVLLNLEMAATPAMVRIATRIRPDLVTLVPERRAELTTEGGLEITRRQAQLKRIVQRLQRAGITVSLFIDPEPRQIRASKAVGAERIELHTGRYCDATSRRQRSRELGRVVAGARLAFQLQLGCAAGHGLNLDNVAAIACIPQIDELNIGHSIVARSVLVGFKAAVAEMLAAMRAA